MRRSITVVTVAAMTFAGAATGCSVQTAGAPTGDLTVSATFDDVQSLVVGHSVQLSDVRIGTVTGVRLDGYRARVTMSIADDRRLPADVTAAIARTSLLGENYVRLELPSGHDLRSGPYLPNGGSITHTSVQPDLEQVSAKAGPLLSALGGQDVATITDAGATALSGKGEQLNRMIAQASKISDSYAAASTDLSRALDALGKLGSSLAKGSGQLDRLPGNVQLATQRLQADRAELKRSVQELSNLGRAFNKRVRSPQALRLQQVLNRTDVLLAAASRGRQDLKALALELVRFLKSPRVSYEGQGLLYIWLAGFLPSPDGGDHAGSPTGARDTPNGKTGTGKKRVSPQSTDLRRLMGPRS